MAGPDKLRRRTLQRRPLSITRVSYCGWSFPDDLIYCPKGASPDLSSPGSPADPTAVAGGHYFSLAPGAGARSSVWCVSTRIQELRLRYELNCVALDCRQRGRLEAWIEVAFPAFLTNS